MGALSLITFVIIVWGRYSGELGIECNHSSELICNTVFRARSATFATLIFDILLFAFELKSFDRSMFNLDPETDLWQDLTENKTLLFSVVGGMITVILPIYIPGFNNRVFYQAPIGWEWGLVAAMTIAFVIWCEVWKLIRKPLYKRWDYGLVKVDVAGEGGVGTEPKVNGEKKNGEIKKGSNGELDKMDEKKSAAGGGE